MERSAPDVSRYHPISYIDVVYSVGKTVDWRVIRVRFSVGSLWFSRLRSIDTGSGWTQFFSLNISGPQDALVNARLRMHGAMQPHSPYRRP